MHNQASVASGFFRQLQDLLYILGPHHLLSQLERVGDVLLSENHRLFGNILGAFAGGLGLAFECGDRVVRRGNEAVESLSRLLDALFGKRSHFGGNLETIWGSHAHLLLWPGKGSLCWLLRAWGRATRC